MIQKYKDIIHKASTNFISSAGYDWNDQKENA